MLPPLGNLTTTPVGTPPNYAVDERTRAFLDVVSLFHSYVFTHSRLSAPPMKAANELLMLRILDYIYDSPLSTALQSAPLSMAQRRTDLLAASDLFNDHVLRDPRLSMAQRQEARALFITINGFINV